MRIRFDAARSEPFLWKETIELSAEELQGLDLVSVGRVDSSGSLSFSDPDFALRCELAYDQTVLCNRCLKQVAIPAAAGIDLVLVERGRPRHAESEAGLAEADLGVMEVAGEGLDTRPLVLEQISLGVPMKPLCREDCRGLCPECGVDRNEASCDCAERTANPRWAGLAALRGSLPDSRPGES